MAALPTTLATTGPIAPVTKFHVPSFPPCFLCEFHEAEVRGHENEAEGEESENKDDDDDDEDDDETYCDCKFGDCTFCEDVQDYDPPDPSNFCGCQPCLDRLECIDPDMHWLFEDLHHSTESVYLDSEKLRAAGLGGVHYDRCSSRELKRSVNERGIQDPYPSGLTLKSYYIPLLHAADKAWTFRLMDLPPELRNRIYRELLVSSGADCPNCETSPRFVEILRACSQVNREASDILYGENTIPCRFMLDIDTEDFKIAAVSNHIDVGAHGNSLAHLPEAIDAYPSYLRRVHRIDVFVHMRALDHVPTQESQNREMNRMLFGLTSFLMEGHQLRFLNVNVHIIGYISPMDLDITLYPLRKLHGIPNLKLVDYRGQTLPLDSLRRELTAATGRTHLPARNVLREWRNLSKLVPALRSLAAHADQKHVCYCGECPGPYDKLRTLLNRLHATGHRCASGKTAEEKLRNAIDDCRSLNRQLIDDNLHDLKQELRKVRSSKQVPQVTEAQRVSVGLYCDSDDDDGDSPAEWSDSDG